MRDWVHVLTALAAHPIRTPTHLAQLKWSEISDLAETSRDAQSVMLLRQATSIQTGGSQRTVSGDRPIISPEQPAPSCRGRRLNQTTVAKARGSAMAMIGIPAESGGIGPASRNRKLGKSPNAAETMAAFLNTGSRLNLIRQVQDSTSSVSSGSQRYGSFSDLLGVPYFPPSSDFIPKWSEVFAPGRTFGMYVSHLA